MTSAAIIGACALNANTRIQTFFEDEFNGDVISAIETNKNFAFQGGFDTFDGELPGEWRIKGPTVPSEKDKERFIKRELPVPEYVQGDLSGIKETDSIEVISTEKGNALHLKKTSPGYRVVLETNISVTPGSIYGLYFETKINEKFNYTFTRKGE